MVWGLPPHSRPSPSGPTRGKPDPRSSYRSFLELDWSKCTWEKIKKPDRKGNGQVVTYYLAVFRIRSRKFLGLSDPLVRCTDPDSDPSFDNWFLPFFISMMNDVNAPSKTTTKNTKKTQLFFAVVRIRWHRNWPKLKNNLVPCLSKRLSVRTSVFYVKMQRFVNLKSDHDPVFFLPGSGSGSALR